MVIMEVVAMVVQAVVVEIATLGQPVLMSIIEIIMVTVRQERIPIIITILVVCLDQMAPLVMEVMHSSIVEEMAQMAPMSLSSNILKVPSSMLTNMTSKWSTSLSSFQKRTMWLSLASYQSSLNSLFIMLARCRLQSIRISLSLSSTPSF